MAKKLEGKTAIITGGASGIGFAIAAKFASEGAQVFIADVSLERCEEACRAIGANTRPQQLDVRAPASIEAMAESVARAAGNIDILVNCAGVFSMQKITDVTAEEFDRVFAVNLRGLLLTLSAVAKRMIAAGKGGAIVNIASGAGRRGPPAASIYGASKAGVISVTQSTAQELIPHGIRVNAIAPGAVQTPMWKEVKALYGSDAEFKASGLDIEAIQVAATPAGRMSTPADYVGAALFLASSDSDYVLGQTINVDGGMNMA